MLGTAAGPSLQKARNQPANAIIVNDSVYIIDTGDGLARQMAKADIPARKLRAVITIAIKTLITVPCYFALG